MDEDGYTYWWDGEPPTGDLDDADINSTGLFAFPPMPGSSGWMAAEVSFNGDQYKIDLQYSLYSGGNLQYYNSAASSNWRTASVIWDYRFFQRGEYKKSLEAPSGSTACDYRVIAGGTAYARKAIPFGIPWTRLRFLTNFAIVHWGEHSQELPGRDETGPGCDDDLSQYECDDENTPTIEYCHPPGDPADDPNGPIGGNTGPTSDTGFYYYNSGPRSSGECVSGMNWYRSEDGGRTWSFWYFECYAYA